MRAVLIIFSFFLTYISYSNENKKEIKELIENNHLFKENKINIDKKINLFLFCGIGFASDLSDWGRYFRFAPAFSFGLELPFESNRNFGIEFYGHLWYAKSSKNDGYLQRIYYFELSKDYYLQGGISPVIKLCLDKFELESNKLTWFAHLGFFINFKGEYKTIDAGTSLNFDLNENYELSLNYRLLFDLTLNGEMQTNPNLMMLNICYNLNW